VRVSAGGLDAVRRARAELAAVVAAAADRAAAHCAARDGAQAPGGALVKMPSGHRAARGQPAAEAVRAGSVAMVSCVVMRVMDPFYRARIRWQASHGFVILH